MRSASTKFGMASTGSQVLKAVACLPAIPIGFAGLLLLYGELGVSQTNDLLGLYLVVVAAACLFVPNRWLVSLKLARLTYYALFLPFPWVLFHYFRPVWDCGCLDMGRQSLIPLPSQGDIIASVVCLAIWFAPLSLILRMKAIKRRPGRVTPAGPGQEKEDD